MNASSFLTTLTNRDIRVWAEGERLRCNAPAGALTNEIREELLRHKNEILEFLHSANSLAQEQRSIVPLQPRGTRPPVFALGGHNGDVFCFRALARYLGEEQPLFGLQPPGLERGEKPLERIEDLASYFANEIRAFWTQSPYVVAGYCAGGTLAFELARKLLQEGEPVRFLALFGAPYPTSYRRLWRLHRLITEQAGRVLRQVRLLQSMSPTERRLHIAQKLRCRKPGGLAKPPQDASMAHRRTAVERATFAAIRHYVPGHFAGPLVHFLPSSDWANSTTQALRWRAAAERAHEYYGPTGCVTDVMLLEPHARVFAGLFKKVRDFLS
jgi:thioesterase domain-containing protein